MITLHRPIKRVTKCVFGAGSDRLTLECGHEVVRTHRSSVPKTARCIKCGNEAH